MYEEDDYLMLSGIQHFAYCRRQWALIHMEQQWAENERTVDGYLFHSAAHDETNIEKRGDLLIMRGLRIKSAKLGMSGACDVVEFHGSDEGISLSSYKGLWIPYPVEYKKGKMKENDADELQLCAQAICLEEMLACRILVGSLFYGENRRRRKVEFTNALREKVYEMSAEMHDLWKKGYTPKVKWRKGCSACSLRDICVPKLGKEKSVAGYIDRCLLGE